MVQLESFSVREIGGRERLEDYVTHEEIITEGGLNLHIIMVCDGTGGGDAGEQASRLTARTIIDSMAVSTIQNVPRLMVQAIEQANTVVYSELRGSGSSTLAMAVVNLNDGDFGRLYIASVGNSRIYLIRERELVRLNIDHTLANEYVYAGHMSVDEAQRRLENPNYLTRVIGVNPEIQVDIGFYVERGNPVINAQRAFNIGKQGLLLKDGDTIFAGTQGIFRSSAQAGEPIITNEEFRRHAMDDDAERAVRNLLRYGSARHPDDNLSLAMLFVPSRFRSPVRVTRMSRRTQIFIALGSLISLVVIGILGTFAFITQAENRDLIRQQNDARTGIAVIATSTAQAQITPSLTPTPLPTATFTPFPTPTPVDAQRQVGNQFFGPDGIESNAVFLNSRASSDRINYLSMRGLNPDQLPDTFTPALMFLQEDSEVRIVNVNNTAGEEAIIFDIFFEADTFTVANQFANGTIRAQVNDNREIFVESRAECLAAKQIPPDPNDPEDTDKIAFTCLTNDPSACTYTLPGQPAVEMPPGRRVLLDITEERFIIDEEPYYEEMVTYYDTIFALTNNSDLANCTRDYLDIDSDNIPYPFDECEDIAGTEATAGCPDDDTDGIRNQQDRCPQQSGPLDNEGCPLDTPTPIPDQDGDGVPDVLDDCPDVVGTQENGCPADIDVDTY